MLKYTNYGICFQEVPDEVSLFFNISNCQMRCPDCHSKFLWEDIGEPLIENIIPIISKYEGMITCVCFMGGTHDMKQLHSAIDIVKANDLKVCIYTGEDYSDKFEDILQDIDYLKVGSYKSECGGLDHLETNQRFYLVVNKTLVNMTDRFKKEKLGDYNENKSYIE